MSVRTTQLHGMETQILSWISVIEDMDEYEAEDHNPLYELTSALEEARDAIFYALRMDNE